MQTLPSLAQIPRTTLPDDFPYDMGQRLAQKYEELGPIFRVPSPWQEQPGDLLFLVGPEANRTVLLSHRHAFSHAIGWGQMFGVKEMFGDGILTMDGPAHDEQRRMMNPAFAAAYMGQYLPVMQRLVREYAAQWAADGTVDVFARSRDFTFAVAAETLAGLSAGDEVQQFARLYFGLLTAGDGVTTQEEWVGRVSALNRDLYALLLPQIEKRRRTPTDDVLGMLISARDHDGNALSDEQLIAHLNILLVAGHETSTSLASWLLYMLAAHPEYAARVRAEQDGILGDRDEPTLTDVQHMKVLDNALSETERLYPPVANGPRGVLEDVPFGNYVIPAGSRVFYSIVASHYLPSVWHDPLRFDPDRFAAPREEGKRNPYALVGFGGGPRICIGINFAKTEIKALATHILRHYDLHTVPGQEPVQRYDVTASPPTGIMLRFTPRDRN